MDKARKMGGGGVAFETVTGGLAILGAGKPVGRKRGGGGYVF